MTEYQLASASEIPQWTLADRLRKARDHAGLNQADFAKRIGIARSSIVNYETGRTSPSRPVILSWAFATGVSLEWLIGDTPNSPNKRRLRTTERREQSTLRTYPPLAAVA